MYRVETSEGRGDFQTHVGVFWVSTFFSNVPAIFVYGFSAECMGEGKVAAESS